MSGEFFATPSLIWLLTPRRASISRPAIALTRQFFAVGTMRAAVSTAQLIFSASVSGDTASFCGATGSRILRTGTNITVHRALMSATTADASSLRSGAANLMYLLNRVCIYETVSLTLDVRGHEWQHPVVSRELRI